MQAMRATPKWLGENGAAAAGRAGAGRPPKKRALPAMISNPATLANVKPFWTRAPAETPR